MIKELTLDKILGAENVASLYGDQDRDNIGSELVEAVGRDDGTRSTWLENNKTWTKLASQVVEKKTTPWPGASNVKYPLLNTAAIQFHARSYPALVGTSQIVKGVVLGKDPTGGKKLRADRISRFMSYQIMEEMDEWKKDFDKLLFILPIIGAAFKKTYYSFAKKRNVSELVLPHDLIVSYHAKDLINYRVTHRMLMTSNEIKEYQRKGFFLDVDLGDPISVQHTGSEDDTQGLSDPGVVDDETPYEIYEVHHWKDLDGDGYKEPYTSYVHKDTATLLAIIPRFNEDSVEYNDKGEVSKISSINFFTGYYFLHDPGSTVYGMGFGNLVGPLNEAVNTLTNQLIDGGTLANLGGGFLGKGIRLRRGGKIRFSPGEWLSVNSTGDDLRKGIFPLPIREPSGVLFNLLGMLVSATERMASVTDMMVGETPGQNTPATTSMAALEQGMKVFTGIYKRVHESLTEEFKKLYALNRMYLDQETYVGFLDEDEVQPEVLEDFDDTDMDIAPTADGNILSETHKEMKASMLMQDMQAGLPINPSVAARVILETRGYDNLEELLEMPEPAPDPEIVLKEKELELRSKELEIEAMKVEAEILKNRSAALLNIARAEEADDKVALERYKMDLKDLSDKESRLTEMEIQMSNERIARDNNRSKESNSNPQ